MQNWKRDTDVQNRLLDSVGEGKGGMFRENSIETSILSGVKQITSPHWMHETSAQGWCTGKTRGMGWGGRREGGSGWGTHVNPWLIHVNVWQNPLKYCKVISLQLVKINEKKRQEDFFTGIWEIYHIFPQCPVGGRCPDGYCPMWSRNVNLPDHKNQVIKGSIWVASSKAGAPDIKTRVPTSCNAPSRRYLCSEAPQKSAPHVSGKN